MWIFDCSFMLGSSPLQILHYVMTVFKVDAVMIFSDNL